MPHLKKSKRDNSHSFPHTQLGELFSKIFNSRSILGVSIWPPIISYNFSRRILPTWSTRFTKHKFLQVHGPSDWETEVPVRAPIILSTLTKHGKWSVWVSMSVQWCLQRWIPIIREELTSTPSARMTPSNPCSGANYIRLNLASSADNLNNHLAYSEISSFFESKLEKVLLRFVSG